jgi:ribonuclease Z
VVSALRVIAPELPFPIECMELSEGYQKISFDGFYLEAFKVNHNVICYGYNVVVERIGRFNPQKAVELGIEVRFWNRLQKGEVIEADGKTFSPDMVLGEKRKGLKVTYTTDTRPTDSIIKNAKNADLFICEGMYGEPDKIAKAKEYKHMTFYEAASLAKQAEVSEMWLTHYSPSLTRPEEYMDEVRRIFPNSIAAKDGRTAELVFEEE